MTLFSLLEVKVRPGVVNTPQELWKTKSEKEMLSDKESPLLTAARKTH